MSAQPDFAALAGQFDHAGVAAVVLMGSYARGAAGPYSDIDLVRFTIDDKVSPPGGGSHLLDGRLVVVSDITPAQVEATFNRPEAAVETMQGLRGGRALIDRDCFFRKLQQRASAFQWDQALQTRANRWAGRQMVGLIEEMHKGLGGLQSGDTGRLLHARFGCTWGLARVMCVQRGVLLDSDNALFAAIIANMGADSAWARLYRSACGAGPQPSTLIEQVRAGLQLYSLTAAMLDGILLAEDQVLVSGTAALIDKVLAAPGKQGRTQRSGPANPV